MAARGLGQKDLCEYLGVSPSVFSEWKSGKSKSVKQYIDLIAEFLGCTSDYLLGSSPGNEAALNPTEVQLVQDYRELSTEGKAHIQKTVEMAKVFEKHMPVVVFRAARGGGAPKAVEITQEEADRLLSLPGEEEDI